MSLLFVDGFDHYPTADILMKWDVSNGASIVTASPRTGAGNGQISGAAEYFHKYFASTINTVCVGFALRIAGATSHGGFWLTLDGAEQVRVTINSDRTIAVKTNTTVLGTTVSPVIPLNTWVYLEFKILVHASAGTYDVYVNGVNVLTGTGKDTRLQTVDGVNSVKLFGATEAFDFDDLYIDSATIHGDSRIDTVYPDGAGNYAQWTPSAGSNYQNVDESAQDGDTTYNATDVLNEIDTYSFTNISTYSSTIRGVALNANARKDDAGTRKITPLTRVSAADFTGTEVGLYDSYRVYQQVWDDDPNAAADWTETTINGAEFGVKLTT